jgi:predicted nucleic acid-binding Zn ribbon protein
MSGERQRHLSGVQLVACPSCNAPLKFGRSPTPHIDDCGFESYHLECKECGAALAGIIDPADDALLLTECDAPLKVAFSRMAV